LHPESLIQAPGYPGHVNQTLAGGSSDQHMNRTMRVCLWGGGIRRRGERGMGEWGKTDRQSRQSKSQTDRYKDSESEQKREKYGLIEQIQEDR
jgi:hypothetical protein